MNLDNSFISDSKIGKDSLLMPLVCRQCSRVNPEEAYYCYFDGAALAGRTESAGPINLGAQPFPSPFVFPSGVNCRNFDQLAMACQQNWKEASNCLKEGFLGSFFGAIGRADLSRVAKEAAAFPDINRGLDQLLGKLPSQTLEAPKLRVEPTEINLGQLTFGTDRKLDVGLENQGMRLIYGTITSDVPWLAVGDHSSRIFEFTDELNLPVQIRGKSLRARLKEQQGHLVVESNAGNFILTVKIEVPPVPFEEGVLAGALSPRQIAEKARANPQGVVPLFETGKVAKWFADNGLTYPVQGPTAPGTAGVQQFFEALGLAKPPKVDFTPQPITLSGDPGQVFEVPLTVSTQDKKLVYAYATGDQPWIDGNTVKPAGRTCTIQLKVTVPPRPGETIAARVTVHANGSQKFQVPLTLTVSGKKGDPVAFMPVEQEATFAPASAPEPAFTAAGEETIAFTPAKEETAFQAVAASPAPAAVSSGPKTPTPSRPKTSPVTPVPPTRKAAAAFIPEGDGDIDFGPAIPKVTRQRSRIWLHAMPAAILVCAIGALMVRDYYSANAADDIDRRDRIALKIDYSPRSEKGVTNSHMFGLQDLTNPAQAKQLTFSPMGQTNSVVLSIDGNTRVFGKIQHGKFEGPPQSFKDRSRVVTFVFTEELISVKQHLQLIPGDPIEVSEGVFKRFYDTCLIRYTVKNEDTKPHTVGLRFLLDTYIGANDVPLFTLPGRHGLVKTILELSDKDIPDYIQALEVPNVQNPGVIAQLNLKISDRLEFPQRVSLTEYPGTGPEKNEFEIVAPGTLQPKKGQAPPARDGGVINDSAIALFWKTEPMPPGKTREFGFTYGVGNVGGLAELTILNPGPVVQGSDFSLVALIANASKGTEATITLPEGLELTGGSQAKLTLTPPAAGQPAPATWTVHAPNAGSYKITVTSGGFTTHRVVTVRKTSIF